MLTNRNQVASRGLRPTHNSMDPSHPWRRQRHLVRLESWLCLDFI